MLTLLLSKTFLTKPLSFSIVKRFMRSVTNMAKTLLIPKPLQINYISKRFGGTEKTLISLASRFLQTLVGKSPRPTASVVNAPLNSSGNNKPPLEETSSPVPLEPKPSFSDTLVALKTTALQIVPSPHKTSGLLSSSKPSDILDVTKRYIQGFIMEQNKLQRYIQHLSDKKFIIEEDHFKDYLVGVGSLSSTERIKLVTDLAYRKEFAKLVSFTKAMIFSYCFEKPLTAEKLFAILPKIFSTSPKMSIWLQNRTFRKLFIEKGPMILQHFLSLSYPKITFSIRELKRLLGNILELNDLKYVTINNLVELHVTEKILGGFLSEKHINYFDGNVRVIDPGSPLLQSGDMYDPKVSMHQIKQPYSDLFITMLNATEKQVRIIRIHRDVKMDYRGPLTGHLTFKVFVASDYYSIKTWTNDITLAIKSLLTRSLSINSRSVLKNSLQTVKVFHTQITTVNIRETYLMIQEELLRLTFNKSLIEDGIHFSLATDFDTNNDPIINDIITNIDNDPNLLQYADPDIQFPKQYKIYQIPWKDYHKLSVQAIRSHVPELIRDEVLKNYTNMFLKFCKDNCIEYPG